MKSALAYGLLALAMGVSVLDSTTLAASQGACTSSMPANGYCDIACNSTDFGFDGGDCLEPPTVCQAKWVGNRVCDELCNNEQWNWDAGDCFVQDPCVFALLGNGYCDWQCNNINWLFDWFDCPWLDAEVVDLCDVSKIGDGVCDTACETELHSWDGYDCARLVWTSDADIVVESSQDQMSVVIDRFDTWADIPEASWIWISPNWDVGTYLFFNIFTIPDYLQSKVLSVTLELAVDDYADIYLNGYLIASGAGNWYTVSTYDLTPYIQYSTLNYFRFDVTNTGGPGGLTFKVKVNTN